MSYETRKQVIEAFGKPRNWKGRLYKARMLTNVFGAPALAAAGTIAATRYTGFPKSECIGQEIAYWAWSALCSLPLQFFAVPAGLGVGLISGLQFAESEARKKRNLEAKLEDSEKVKVYSPHRPIQFL